MAVRIHDSSMFGRVQQGDPRSPIRNLSRLVVIRESTHARLGMDSCESKLNAIFSVEHVQRLVGLLVNVGTGKVGMEELCSVLGTEFQQPPKHLKSKL